VDTGPLASQGRHPPHESAEPPRQEAIGPYKIESTLGKGTHGTCYLVGKTDSNQKFVLKTYSSSTRQEENNRDPRRGGRSEMLRVLRRELSVLKAADHPGIPRVLDCDEFAAQPYLVMPYEEGATLETATKERSGPWPEDEIRDIAISAANTLEGLHSAGYLHGDVKPANLCVNLGGRVMLLDFAGARSLSDPKDDATVQSYATPGFAPLERYREEVAEGPWTDVYSLAATLYWCIAGFPPAAAPARHDGEGLVPARYLGKGKYSEEFLEAIDRGLALHPEKRPQTPRGFAAQLRPGNGQSDIPAPTRTVSTELKDSSASSWEPVFDDCPETQRIARAAQSELPSAFRSGAGQDRNGAGNDPPRRRRPYWVLLILLLLLAGGGWAGWQTYLRYFKTEWIVDASGGGDTTTIGEALERAKAEATLLIRPGRYEESLTIDRNVTLIGEPEGTVKPIVAPTAGPCLAAAAPRAAFRGLHFLQSAAGTPEKRCVVLSKGTFTVEDSFIENTSGPGLVAEAGATIVLKNLTFPNIAGTAIAIYDGSIAEINGVQISHSASAGIWLRGGSKATIGAANIENSGEAGLLVAEGSEAVMRDSLVRKGQLSAVEVREAAKLTATNIKLEDSQGAGLYVYAEGRAEIEQSQINRNACCGAIVEPTAFASIRNSVVRENKGHGVVFLNSSVGQIDKSQIVDNAEHGLLLDDAADVEVGNNEIEGNGGSDLLRARLKTKEVP